MESTPVQQNPFLIRFKSEIQGWFLGIKAVAMEKIANLPLVQACARGDVDAIKLMLLVFSPFIDEFPEHIDDATKVMVRGRYLSRSQRPDFRTLMKEVSSLLPGIREDEEEHRKLWINSAAAMGIPRTAYDRFAAESKQVPGMEELLHLTHDSSITPRTLIRFAAVEIVAESLSKTVLASPKFCEIMGPQGLSWFRVHAEHHGEETHETLVLRLAFALLRRQNRVEGYKDRPLDPNPEDINRWIQETTDAFVVVANGAYNKAYVN